MTQRNRRIHTFSILFGVDYPGPEDAKERVDEYLAGLEAEDDEELVERGLEEIPSFTETELFEFKKRFGEIIEALPEMDAEIDRVSEGWTFARMTQVDRTILRLGAYEMLKDDDVPVKVAINEAVELAKIYGNPKSPSFVNGILAKLVK